MVISYTHKNLWLFEKENFIEPEDGVDAENLPTFLISCFICPCLLQPDIIQQSVFYVDLKAIKTFDQVKTRFEFTSFTVFSERRVKVDDMVSVKR